MTRFFETDPHPLDVVTISIRPEVEATTCCDDIVQQLFGAVAELLLFAFARRPGLFLSAGAFSFCIDAFGFFLKASGSFGCDLGSPSLSAACDVKEATVVERTRRDAMRATFVCTVFASGSDPPQEIELGHAQIISGSSHPPFPSFKARRSSSPRTVLTISEAVRRDGTAARRRL
ncbi:hypothetical protein NJB14197_09050 [Mycobacterium montefiorense]|uniref:Uncharacterized protein n=1 Tax=Mycobacterium montefiorense TaxID=154654 RepID=A0AA37PMI9_9MYCO|nr:hypothetical protein MmonteBS_12240 [Mycobacterium montefiorense]GKU37759.1 hypothetical protein NJB14191_51050 [Mycobacterium montefiorense]GKU42717.1 hypothetical protein NJB14192_47000 [Mycobacterium montefiorense]GKU46407.1 hypothetical protein NJB14194_30260 [Mycobacterium montefiorense]GKU51010.1 hypothetical protein NJB14195_22560 [Mycobacterium montefiorense]